MDRNPLEYPMMTLLFLFLPVLLGVCAFEVAVWAGMSAHWAKGPAWIVGIAVAIYQVYILKTS